MNTPDLRSLIADGETLKVEFKGEARAQLSDDDVVEAVICLANRASSEPAWLLIGVEDDGRVTGARPRHGDHTDRNRLQAMIANRTRPSLAVEADLVTLDGQAVLAIQVPSTRVPVGTTEGRYLRRVTGGRGRPECVPLFFHDMVAIQADQGLLDYSALVLPGVGWDDLDPLEFERFRRSIREAKGLGDASLIELPDLELAKALGAVDANHTVRGVRVLGLLLFGREDALRSHLPTHEAAFQQLSGLQVVANEFFRLPLIRLMDELMARFRARYREDEVMVGMLRVGVPDYPERAFREGVANALVHQDLTRLAAVHVQWHDDRIEISNPGGFPEGVRLDNLLVTPPRPRSPLLADAFKRAGIVERTARGIDTIFYEQLRNGRPAPVYGRSTERDVILVLPGGEANLDFVRLVTEVSQSGRALGLDELLVLNALWLERRVDTARAAKLMQKQEADARHVLNGLVEAGLVEAQGAGNRRSYLFSARTYEKLGAKAAYVRQRGFDTLRQEAMILEYVAAHGHITRREAAGLCNMTERQASERLYKMTEAGKLKGVGERRGRHYVLP